MSDGRIKVVHAVNSLALAGAERTTTEIVCSLDPTEFDVHVLVVRNGPLSARLAQAGVAVHVVGGEFDIRFPLTVARTVRVLRALAPSIVHTHMIGSDITAGLAARLAGVPVWLTTQHDTYHRAWPFNLFRRWSGPRLDAAVAISPSVVEYCRESLHVPAERIHVIENAVELDRFEPALRPQRRPPTFGAIGTLIPVKGHETLIEAFAQVVTSVPGSRLILAGQGPMLGRLKATVDRLGLAQSVEFRGLVDDIPEFLGEVDILVHPSLQEAFGLALVEGMASRKAVIASDLPAIRHVLGDGAAGLLVKPGDVGGLAEAMHRLGTDVGEARRLAEAGFRRAEAQYCGSRMAGQYAALYHLLLAEHRPRSG